METGLRQSAVEQTPTASSKVTGHREMTPMRGNGGTHSKSPSSEMKGKGLQVWKRMEGHFHSISLLIYQWSILPARQWGGLSLPKAYRKQ